MVNRNNTLPNRPRIFILNVVPNRQKPILTFFSQEIIKIHRFAQFQEIGCRTDHASTGIYLFNGCCCIYQAVVSRFKNRWKLNKAAYDFRVFKVTLNCWGNFDASGIGLGAIEPGISKFQRVDYGTLEILTKRNT